MQLLSINVSQPVEVMDRGRPVRTGIFKQPISGRVRVGQLNVEGDGQADLEAHGGVDKAVYAYPYEHYAAWKAELGWDEMPYGQFGENLTLEGLLETDVCIGDVLETGSTRMQVTQPRTPCYKLGIRMGMPDFPKRFLQSERSGFYLRVLQEGEIEDGDAVTIVERDPHGLSIQAFHHLVYQDRENREGLRRAAQIDALAEVWREVLEKWLA